MKWQVPSLGRRGWSLALLICAFALFLRIWNIGFPDKTYFDEVYYGPAACDYLNGRADSNTVHPPLGKLQIAVGISTLTHINKWSGRDIFSQQWQWRITSVICGTLMVFFTYLLGHHISRGQREVALLAAFFVAIDFMAVTTSRVCMLDMVNAMWITVAMYCCWRYIEDCWNEKKSSFWAWGCALAIGIATACKWNGLFAGGGCWLAMVLLRDMSFAKSSGLLGKQLEEENNEKISFKQVLENAWKPGVKLGLLLASVTAIVYIASYTPMFWRLGIKGEVWKDIWGFHTLMWNFRHDPEQFKHSYLSSFWSWPLVLRPIWLFFETGSNRVCVNGIVVFGSVLFWWSTLIYMIESAYYGLSRRDAVRLFLVGLWLVQWLLWASSTTGGFIYYMVPVVPLMALIAALVICDWDCLGGSWMAVAYIVVLTAMFIAYWPFLSGETTTMHYFNKMFPTWATRWR